MKTLRKVLSCMILTFMLVNVFTFPVAAAPQTNGALDLYATEATKYIAIDDVNYTYQYYWLQWSFVAGTGDSYGPYNTYY